MMSSAKTVLRVTWALLRIGALVLLWAPWVLLYGARGGVRLAAGLVRAPRRLLAAAKDEVVCRRCRRRQSLLQRWRCPVCKAVESTHAWAPCTTCVSEVPAGYVACEDPECGEAIQNPKLRGAS